MAFWDQFQLHGPMTGGITGTPSVDPAQLQQVQPESFKPDYSQNTGIAGATVYGTGLGVNGQPLPPDASGPIFQSQGGPMSDPRWTNGTWGGPAITDPGYANRPKLDPKNLPWAPDWQSRMLPPDTQPSLTGGTGRFGSMLQSAMQPLPDYASTYTTLSQLGQRGGFLGALMNKAVGTGVTDPNSGLAQAYTRRQGQQQAISALLHRVRTPDGRLVQVPDSHLAEALQRGGMKL